MLSCSSQVVGGSPGGGTAAIFEVWKVLAATAASQVLNGSTSAGDFLPTARTAILTMAISVSFVCARSPAGIDGTSARPSSRVALSTSTFTISGASSDAERVIAQPTATAPVATPRGPWVSERTMASPAAAGAADMALHSSAL
jgi:hypothetical protein